MTVCCVSIICLNHPTFECPILFEDSSVSRMSIIRVTASKVLHVKRVLLRMISFPILPDLAESDRPCGHRENSSYSCPRDHSDVPSKGQEQPADLPKAKGKALHEPSPPVTTEPPFCSLISPIRMQSCAVILLFGNIFQ
jgi:hypothetical protein